MPLPNITMKRDIPDIPCISCPLSREVKGTDDEIYPFCNIYSNQIGVGLESCEEIIKWINDNNLDVEIAKDCLLVFKPAR
jgi:hypothetical protein